MSPWTILGAVVVLALLGYFVLFNSGSNTGGRVDIVKGSQRGEVQTSSSLSLPISYNEPEGLTYSYACWILVKNFTVGYGNRRRIFSREDAPSLYIDSTSNSLSVTVDTFGAKEVILIPNLPAEKWIHFALVVDQHAVDVYINGTLRQHQTLAQLPKQKDTAVVMGPGWDGVLARLSYWARSLQPEEVRRLSEAPLPDDLDRKPSGPQYFDITWYIGRLYST
jgi:hypothetical protein